MKKLLLLLFISLLPTGCATQHIVNAIDPCKDKVLLMLESKDSLSVEEMKLYSELQNRCIENINSKLLINETAKIASALKVGVGVYVITTLVVIVWAIAEATK